MYAIALLMLGAVAAVSAALLRLAGAGVAARDLAVVFGAILVAVEASLLVIRLLKGRDQASATQAGMSGMVLLMLLSVGILGACLLMGVLQGDAAVRCSPLLFLAALVLVAVEAIRTIRSAQAGSPGIMKDQSGNVK